MFKKTCLTVSVAAIALSGCGKKDGGSSDGLYGERGVVQGVVIDAITGERVDIPEANGARGVNVLIQHTYKGAQSKSGGYNKDDSELVKGEYYIPSIPVGQRFPIIANIEGYQTFEGEIMVEEGDTSRRQACTTKECRDAIAAPTRIANIQVYPLGKYVKDLSLEVRKGENRVTDAEIVIKPVHLSEPSVSLEQESSDGDFLPSKTTRIAPISGKTNSDGVLNVKAANLVLGQTYVYVIHTGRSSEKGDHKGQFTFGSSAQSPGFGVAQDENDRFKVRVQLN